MAGSVAPISSHCWVNPELGSWGVTAKIRFRLKGFKGIWNHRSEQTVVPPDLGTAPSATLILHLIQLVANQALQHLGQASVAAITLPMATLPTCLYWSSWEKKQFRRAAPSGHWETSLSQVSLLPPTGQGIWATNLSWVTETTSGSLSIFPCQGQQSCWGLSITVRRTNHCSVALEKYTPGFSTTLEEARLVLSHSPTFLISKHESLPLLRVTVPLTACDRSPGQHWHWQAAPRQHC